MRYALIFPQTQNVSIDGWSHNTKTVTVTMGLGNKNVDKSFKFTQETEEYKTHQRMMESGEVTPAAKPAEVKAMKEEFQKIDGDRFRAQYNKLRNLTGLNTREGKAH